MICRGLKLAKLITNVRLCVTMCAICNSQQFSLLVRKAIPLNENEGIYVRDIQSGQVQCVYCVCVYVYSYRISVACYKFSDTHHVSEN